MDNRTIQFPVLKNRVPSYIKEGVIFGITNKSDEKEALEFINKFINDNKPLKGRLLWDFKNSTSIGTRGWSTLNGNINVYENTEADQSNSLVSNELSGWEKVFFYLK